MFDAETLLRVFVGVLIEKKANDALKRNQCLARLGVSVNAEFAFDKVLVGSLSRHCGAVPLHDE
jgi:hypothetical protein